MKTLKYFIQTAFLLSLILMIFDSCKTSLAIKEKTGSVLWSENCSRCHYSPDPEEYNDAQWDVIAMHMRVRTNLTQEESEKITRFLQDAN